MRIALLLEPRVLLLSHADRAAHALGMALHAYGASDDDVILVQPVGDGVIDAATWQDDLARRALLLDDDAAVERRIADASRAFDEGRLDDAHEGYARCDALLADERGPRRRFTVPGWIGAVRTDGDEFASVVPQPPQSSKSAASARTARLTLRLLGVRSKTAE